jgi:predicted PurR-regulated permease PerM
MLRPRVETPENDDVWLTRERALALVLISATALAFYVCYLLAYPFLPSLAWALALAVIAHPLHDWLESRIRRPNIAAGIAVAIVAVAILAPTLFVLHSLLGQVAAGAVLVQEESIAATLEAMATRSPWLAPGIRWVGRQIAEQGDAQNLAATIAKQATTYVTGSLWIVAQAMITLFLLFFFFRDRRPALRALRHLVPLSHDESDEVFTRVEDTIFATLYGSVAVAIIQGTLGGLIFWLLGLPAPLFWGVVMGILAVVPMLGTFVIWVPAAAFLAAQGEWGKALVLVGWGGIVIALVDNLIYPMLVGKRLRLHAALVFIAIVGGLFLFGAAGVVLGPLVLSITDALVDVWRRRTADGGSVEAGVDD